MKIARGVLPRLSVVIATYNSAQTLDACLGSIVTQNYPKNKIEIVVADGGSTDGTLAIARKYGARLVRVDPKKQGAEYSRAIGAHAARGDILVFIDHDNVLPHTLWLRRMVQPFMDEPTLVGAETLRYHYDPSDAPMGRYFALFGVNDIVPFYLGKADRLSYLYDEPEQYGAFQQATVTKRPSYYLVDFSPNAIPTLGSNGFLVRRLVLFQYADVRPEYFFHIDVNVDLIRKGFRRYAFIHDTLHHRTHERGIADYLRRRLLFMERYGLHHMALRRYNVYEPKDKWKLLVFVFYSLTLVVPIIHAIRGYGKVRDIAWFLHPIMCFGTLVVYSWTIGRRAVRQL